MRKFFNSGLDIFWGLPTWVYILLYAGIVAMFIFRAEIFSLWGDNEELKQSPLFGNCINVASDSYLANWGKLSEEHSLEKMTQLEFEKRAEAIDASYKIEHENCFQYHAGYQEYLRIKSRK